MKTGAVIVAALAVMACKESETPVGPVAAAATPPQAASAATECPCWDGALLATAFPAVQLFREADGAASLTRFDLAELQQIQALVRVAGDGGGSCELASFGADGRIEALAAADGLTPGQCAVCGGLLATRAAKETAPAPVAE